MPGGNLQSVWSHGVFGGAQCQDMRKWAQTGTPSEHQEELLSCAGDGALEFLIQNGYGVSLEIFKSQLALGIPA